MIPSIEEIIAGLVSGQYTAAQASAWIASHMELAAELGDEDEALSPEDLALLVRVDDNFSDCGETEVPHDKLLEFALRGYLECERFTFTKKGSQAVRAHAAGVKGDGDAQR